MSDHQSSTDQSLEAIRGILAGVRLMAGCLSTPKIADLVRDLDLSSCQQAEPLLYRAGLAKVRDALAVEAGRRQASESGTVRGADPRASVAGPPGGMPDQLGFLLDEEQAIAIDDSDGSQVFYGLLDPNRQVGDDVQGTCLCVRVDSKSHLAVTLFQSSREEIRRDLEDLYAGTRIVSDRIGLYPSGTTQVPEPDGHNGDEQT